MEKSKANSKIDCDFCSLQQQLRQVLRVMDVNGVTGGHYTTIQDAINNDNGDVILVSQVIIKKM